MKIEVTEALWFDESREVSLAELAEACGISEAELNELVDCGVLAPIDPQANQWTFRSNCLVAARTAFRLCHDLDLDPHGLAVVVRLLERINDLERELRHVRAQIPGGSR